MHLEFENSLPFQSQGCDYSTDVECQNYTYARYMLDNIGGHNSEMTAIAFYFFQAVNMGTENIAEIYSKINQVEMHHLEIFAQLAANLGEKPLLWTNCGRHKVWWSPSYGDYPTCLSQVLQTSLEGEEAAIEKYTWQYEHIDDPVVRRCLHQIIQDEKCHVAIFKHLIECN